MFDVGFQELTLIGVIALIVVGPERLPKMARTLGLWMGKIRYYVGQVKSDIEREVRAQELKEMLDKPAGGLDDLYKVAEETKGTLKEATGALEEAKAAIESAPASISTPNEPAAGSIFPTELPGPSAGSAQIGPEPADPPVTASTETAPEPADPPETVSTETAPEPADPPVMVSTETAPEAADPPETVSTKAAPMTTGPVETGSPESGEVESGVHERPSVATDAGENDERSSGRI